MIRTYPQSADAVSDSKMPEAIPESFRLATYQYDLPDELIAQQPNPSRDQSRLLVLRRSTGEIEHKSFRDLVSFLSLPICLF